MVRGGRVWLEVRGCGWRWEGVARDGRAWLEVGGCG